MLLSGAAQASVVVYDTTGGDSYNEVGPVYSSPEYIGDKFTVSTSGWLNTVALALADVSYTGIAAHGTVTLWSDNSGVVGTQLFSAAILATNFPSSSNSELPPLTTVSATAATRVFLAAGSNYWITLSQTEGSGDLICFSAVNLTSLEQVYFDNNGLEQYGTGSQKIVATISVTPDSNPEANSPTNIIAITATAQLQGITNSGGGVTAIDAPTEHAVNTKLLLEWLAEDEYKAGNYSSSTFPSGAQLALVGADFQILDRHNRFLVDVSNILTCENGINEVVSGRITDRTGLYAPTLTQRYIFKITFNDSSIIGGEGINFYLQGLMTGTTTDMASKPDGKYAESNSNLMPFAMGEGLWQGTPFVISGSLTGAGRLFPIN